MRYQPDQKGVTRSRLLQAVGRGFRRQGFAGIGVDALAKEAGVTSGAFYGHFKSKDAAFAEAAIAALDDLRAGIAALQAEHGAGWLAVFVDFYLGERLRCALDESCGLQSLTPDVIRADEDIRARYQVALDAVAGQVAEGLDGPTQEARRGTGWALLALLSGGVTMARSMASAKAQQALAADLRRAAMTMAASCAQP